MNNFETLNQKIDDLITRFFYKEEQLYFRIMIKLNGGTMLPYNDYADYNEYKEAYAGLVEKKRSGDTMVGINIEKKTNQLDFA